MKIIACSGGPDSMALLDLERKKGTGILVCHVNYHRRPTADRDEDIVRQYCDRYGIEVRVLNPEYAEGNFQAWAREVRYDFFEKTARKTGAEEILIAHQQDDAIETWIFQKQRNMESDWSGLRAETKRHGLTIRRPLLKYTKQQLTDYCIESRVPFGIDESNLEDHYTRNRIRHRLDPEKRPEYLRQISESNRRRLRRNRKYETFFKTHDPGDLLETKEAPELLEAWLHQKTGRHIGRKQCEDLVRQLKTDCLIDLGQWWLERHQNRLIILPKEEAKKEPVMIGTPEELKGCRLIGKTGKTIERFSVDASDFPLTIRMVRQGDRIRLRYGDKKLSRFFIDRKIPHTDRLRWQVIENGEGTVIFVPGIGCDRDHFSKEHVFYMKPEI